jgi:hypothetical protein
MINDGRFIQSVNGRGKKLLFDPDAVEAWVKSRQSPVASTAVTSLSKSEKAKTRAFAERQQRAEQSLERHRRKGKQ